MRTVVDELANAWQAYHGGDLPLTQAICRRLLEDDGDHTGALFLASLVDYQRGDFGASIERLSRVVKLTPDYAEAHNNLGNALAATGELAQAERSFRQALRRKPRYAEALANLGNALRDQRRLDEAIDAYRRALELQPDYAQCLNNLGIALAQKKSTTTKRPQLTAVRSRSRRRSPSHTTTWASCWPAPASREKRSSRFGGPSTSSRATSTHWPISA